MKPSFSANVRHCSGCDRKVYLCHTDAELALYTSLNYCIAIPVMNSGTSQQRSPPTNPSRQLDGQARFAGLWIRDGHLGKAFDEWNASLKPEDIPEFLRNKGR